VVCSLCQLSIINIVVLMWALPKFSIFSYFHDSFSVYKTLICGLELPMSTEFDLISHLTVFVGPLRILKRLVDNFLTL